MEFIFLKAYIQLQFYENSKGEYVVLDIFENSPVRSLGLVFSFFIFIPLSVHYHLNLISVQKKHLHNYLYILYEWVLSWQEKFS